MAYITVTAEAEIDTDDILSEISDKDLINEIKERELDLSQVNLTFDEWELIEMICKNKSIIEADRIRDFFIKP